MGEGVRGVGGLPRNSKEMGSYAQVEALIEREACAGAAKDLRAREPAIARSKGYTRDLTLLLFFFSTAMAFAPTTTGSHYEGVQVVHCPAKGCTRLMAPGLG